MQGRFGRVMTRWCVICSLIKRSSGQCSWPSAAVQFPRDSGDLPHAEKVVTGRIELFGKHNTERHLDAAIRKGPIHYGMLGLTLDHDFDQVQQNIDILTTEMDDIRAMLKAPLIVVVEATTAIDISAANLRRAKRQVEQRCSERPGVGFAERQETDRIAAHLERSLTREAIEDLMAEAA